MSTFDGRRLSAETFKLDVARMRRGWYSDKYFANIVTLLSELSRRGYRFQGQNAALAASNAKWQAAYQQAAALARARDADAKRLAAGLQAATKVDDADHADNQKLATLASDILHLYRTQSFRQLLVKSYEPLLGFYEVRLENTVQDYEDRIYNLRLFMTKAAAQP